MFINYFIFALNTISLLYCTVLLYPCCVRSCPPCATARDPHPNKH